MPALIARLDHDWIITQFEDMFLLPEEPELTTDDIVMDPNLPDAEDLFRHFYPDTERSHRALNILDRIQYVTSLVAPLTLRGSLINLLLDFEWLAHMRFKKRPGATWPKLYRDHVLHPAYACAIGWWMLSDQGPEPLRQANIARLLKDRHGALHPGLDWKDIAQRAWILAALNHDLFYPIEFLREIGERETLDKHSPWERRLKRRKVFETYNSASMDILKSEISRAALEKCLRKVKHPHAPLSALYLIGPESGYSHASRRRKIIHELAAAAVFHHHSDDPRDTSYFEHPLCYLLALADECHEFGREIAVWKGEAGCWKVEFIPSVLASEITLDGLDFSIIFSLNEPGEILKLIREGLNRTMYIAGKNEGFKRLNPLDPSGDCRYGFSFLPVVK